MKKFIFLLTLFLLPARLWPSTMNSPRSTRASTNSPETRNWPAKRSSACHPALVPESAARRSPATSGSAKRNGRIPSVPGETF